MIAPLSTITTIIHREGIHVCLDCLDKITFKCQTKCVVTVKSVHCKCCGHCNIAGWNKNFKIVIEIETCWVSL